MALSQETRQSAFGHSLSRPVALSRLEARLDNFASWANARVERNYWALGSILTAFVFLCLSFNDIRLHLWLDEINTIYIGRQPSLSQIVEATLDGADQAPPLYSMIVHLLFPLISSEALAVRLPSTIGFCAMGLGLLAFLHRRLPALYAFLAVFLAYRLALSFASEGRTYGLVCGLAALSLASWRSLADGQNRAVSLALLAFLSAVMVALHYYAVFFLGCLLLAECVRWRVSGKIDLSVPVALLAPTALVLALHYPLLIVARRFGAHFWETAHFGQIATFYATAPFVAFFLVALLSVTLLPRVKSRRAGIAMPLHEFVAIVAIALAPIAMVIVCMLTTHVFVDRYALWATIGIASLSAVLLCVFAAGRPATAIMMITTLVVLIGFGEVKSVKAYAQLRQAQPTLAALLKLPPSGDLIVVTNPHLFGELTYYGPPGLRERIVYADCPDLDLKYEDFNSATLNLESMSRRSPFKVENCQMILSSLHRFTLAATSSDYLVWVLSSRGRSVAPADTSDPNPNVFIVTDGF